MKKIVLLVALCVCISVAATQLGLSPRRNIINPLEQLQAKYRSTAQPIQAEEIEAPEYAPRGMLIFLAEPPYSCSAFEAVSRDFMKALLQKAGPIVVSATLVHSVLHNYQTSSERNSSWNKAVSLVKYYSGKRAEPDLCNKMIMSFNNDEWLIKEISKEMYLMLPRAYLDTLAVSFSAVEQHNPDGVSDTELKLGLKVNHMRPVSVKEIRSALREPLKDSSYFVEALYKGNLFCTRSDYKGSIVPQTLWSWFMAGHGTFGEKILKMPLEEFKKVLNFCSTQITMKLLMYQSCFAAGENTEKIYLDEKKNIQQSYPFAIVTQAITDAPTAGAVEEKTSEGEFVEVARPNEFATFITLAHKQDTDYERLIACLFHIAPHGAYAGNIAQIKLPGIEWFSTVAGKKDVVTIGSVMARTRTAPLDIQKWVNGDPKALLLETTYIPFEVIINNPGMEYIISTVPGETATYMASLKSSVHDINKVLNWIQSLKIGYLKRIYIERVMALNEEGILTEYKDIFVSGGGNIYFTQASDIFFKKRGEKAISASEEVDFYASTYGQNAFDFIKNKAKAASKRVDVRATESTEGISPESVSKLSLFLESHAEKIKNKAPETLSAAAVGALVTGKSAEQGQEK